MPVETIQNWHTQDHPEQIQEAVMVLKEKSFVRFELS
jgi:hypothetical protein